MKFLMILSVLQTIGIIVLIARLDDNQGGGEPQPVLEQRSLATAALPHLGDGANSIASFADEERLRGIIREELARQLRADQPTTAAAAVGARPHNESMDRRQQELVAQQIETYISTGSITDQQMQGLQAEIAQLDEAGRKQMMSKLIKAMNAGDIKSRL